MGALASRPASGDRGADAQSLVARAPVSRRTKRDIVTARKRAIALADLERLAAMQTVPRGFEAALRTKAESGFALIAEIKKKR